MNWIRSEDILYLYIILLNVFNSIDQNVLVFKYSNYVVSLIHQLSFSFFDLSVASFEVDFKIPFNSLIAIIGINLKKNKINNTNNPSVPTNIPTSTFVGTYIVQFDGI